MNTNAQDDFVTYLPKGMKPVTLYHPPATKQQSKTPINLPVPEQNHSIDSSQEYKTDNNSLLRLDIYYPHASSPTKSLYVDKESVLAHCVVFLELYSEQVEPYESDGKLWKRMPAISFRPSNYAKQIDNNECQSIFSVDYIKMFCTIIENMHVLETCVASIQSLESLRNDFSLGCQQLKKFYQIREEERTQKYKASVNNIRTSSDRDERMIMNQVALLTHELEDENDEDGREEEYLMENLKARYRAQQVVYIQEIESCQDVLNRYGVTRSNMMKILLLSEVLQAPSLSELLMTYITYYSREFEDEIEWSCSIMREKFNQVFSSKTKQVSPVRSPLPHRETPKFEEKDIETQSTSSVAIMEAAKLEEEEHTPLIESLSNLRDLTLEALNEVENQLDSVFSTQLLERNLTYPVPPNLAFLTDSMEITEDEKQLSQALFQYFDTKLTSVLLKGTLQRVNVILESNATSYGRRDFASVKKRIRERVITATKPKNRDNMIKL